MWDLIVSVPDHWLSFYFNTKLYAFTSEMHKIKKYCIPLQTPVLLHKFFLTWGLMGSKLHRLVNLMVAKIKHPAIPYFHGSPSKEVRDEIS